MLSALMGAEQESRRCVLSREGVRRAMPAAVVDLDVVGRSCSALGCVGTCTDVEEFEFIRVHDKDRASAIFLERLGMLFFVAARLCLFSLSS